MTFVASEVERGYALAVSRLNIRVGSSSEEDADHSNATILSGKVKSRATLVIDMVYTRSSYSDQAIYDRVETKLDCNEESGKILQKRFGPQLLEPQ